MWIIKTKNVFKGSSIGKEYGVKGVQDRCVLNQEKIGREIDYSRKELGNILREHSASIGLKELTGFLGVLMKVENNFDYMPRRFQRKIKGRGNST